MTKNEADAGDGLLNPLATQIISALHPILESHQNAVMARIEETDAAVRDIYDSVTGIRTVTDANARSCADTLDGMRKMQSALLKVILDRLNGICQALGMAEEDGQDNATITSRLDAIESTVKTLALRKSETSGTSGVTSSFEVSNEKPANDGIFHGEERSPEPLDEYSIASEAQNLSISRSREATTIATDSEPREVKPECGSPLQSRFGTPGLPNLRPLTPACWDNADSDSNRSTPESDDDPDLGDMLLNACASSDSSLNSPERAPLDPSTPISALSSTSTIVADEIELADKDQDFKQFDSDFFNRADDTVPAAERPPSEASGESGDSISVPMGRSLGLDNSTTYEIPDTISIGGSDLDELLPASVLTNSDEGKIKQSPDSSVVAREEPVDLSTNESPSEVASTVPDRPETPTRENLSPLSDLSSLSSSPAAIKAEPSSESVSVPPAKSRVSGKRQVRLRPKPGQSLTTARVNKRKVKAEESESSFGSETRASKRAKSSQSQKSDASAAPKTPQWPPVSQCNDGFARRVVLCDGCRLGYHYGCVNILRGDPRLRTKAVFKCPVCIVNPKGRTARRRRGKSSSKVEEVQICSRVDCGFKAPEFFVSSIIGRRNRSPSAHGEYDWLVKWLGYPVAEATWELDDAMADPDKLIAEFYFAARREGLDTGPNVPIMLQEALKGGWSYPL